jgi:hypothetical protein
MTRLWIGAIGVVLLHATTPLKAGNEASGVRGKVLDPSGNPISHLTVVARTSTGIEKETRTDAGEYRLDDLVAGPATLTFRDDRPHDSDPQGRYLLFEPLAPECNPHAQGCILQTLAAGENRCDVTVMLNPNASLDVLSKPQRRAALREQIRKDADALLGRARKGDSTDPEKLAELLGRVEKLQMGTLAKYWLVQDIKARAGEAALGSASESIRFLARNEEESVVRIHWTVEAAFEAREIPSYSFDLTEQSKYALVADTVEGAAALRGLLTGDVQVKTAIFSVSQRVGLNPERVAGIVKQGAD